MDKLHLITGLPRAGSTLMCNLLNQHPEFHATSTSPLANFILQIMQVPHNSIEFKNLLDKQPNLTQRRLDSAVRGFINNYHCVVGKPIVFDKSRAWLHHPYAVKRICTETKMIVMVRDLRDVFASIVKQDRKNGLLGTTPIYQKFEESFSPNGIIGSAMVAIANALASNLDNVAFVRYEDFVGDPITVMDDIHGFLGVEEFDYDTENVVNTAIDCDGHYLLKFPHEGSGEIKPNESNWKHWMTEEMGKQILDGYPIYNKTFRYGEE